MEQTTQIIVNKAYRCLYDPTWAKRFNIIKGGAGSAKSYEMEQFILYKMLCTKGNWLIIRKVAETLRESVFRGLVDMISKNGWGHLFKINKTEMSIESIPTGARCVMKGMDDPEKIKSISNIVNCWAEESTELELEDNRQLRMRLRGGGDKYYYYTFNPIDELHWIKAEYFDIMSTRVNILETTYKDNMFMTPEDIAELEGLKEKDEYYYKVYCLGEWGSISNARIYNHFECHDFDIKPTQIYQGMDFGYNDPTAFIRCYVYDQELYIFDEYYKTERIIDDVAKDFAGREDIQEIKDTMTIGDTASPSSIKFLKREGWRITEAKKGHDSVMAGINYIKSFKKVHVHTKCYNTLKEFRAYKFIETKTGIQKDKPLDADNHLMDALRYALENRRLNIGGNVGVNVTAYGL